MMRNYRKLLSTMAMAGFLTGAGCLGGAPVKPTTSTTTTTGSTANDPAATTASNNLNDPTGTDNPNNTQGGTTDTFDHDSTQTIDPFQVLANIEQEGPPEFATRMHSCGKMKYATLGNVLADLGVNVANKTATSAGAMYTAGAGALGQPIYANRIPESAALSTSGAEKMYDIFVAAAPETITAMPTIARCMVAGTATNMFDTTGANCTSAGIACLTGAPSTQAQQDLCDAAVASDTTDKIGNYTVGQIIAVASLLSAAHSCE
jgi:hypothetical protein